MVVRKQKRSRKYLGSRRWGVGNIKNARGAGDRGGVGKGGKKHKFTYVTAKTPELIGKHGFHVFDRKRRYEITLKEIARKLAKLEADGKSADSIDLPGYKILSNGEITRKVRVKAYAFSKKASEKIKAAGGEAVTAAESE
jgi:large subunit ribosomal protein L15